MPFTIITGESFTSTGAAVRINLPSSADYFTTWNMTQMALGNPNTVIKGEWFGPKFGAGQSAAGLGIQTVKTTANLTSNFGAGLGFIYIQTTPTVSPQNAAAITAISAANPAVVTQTNTYSNGDFIRIYNTTGDLTIGGMVFQISSASGAGYSLLGLANIAGNGLAAATAGFTRRISPRDAVNPQVLFITNISQAAQAVVSTSVDPSAFYVVGNKIDFTIPNSFGMTQMNQLTGTVVAVNGAAAASNIGAYNLTVDIDSSAFTAFTFPASALSPTTALFATFAPAGSSTTFNPNTLVQTGYEFQKTPFHTGQFTPYMILAGGAQASAGANGDVINWAAYKFET